MVKDNIHAGHPLRTAVGITIFLLLLSAQAGAVPATGNRIWDESKGMPTTYTWNSYSFSGFYYNLNENLGTEELTMVNINRNMGEGNIRYSTLPIEVNFEYSGFGKYQVIGFMADKYFAGYTRNSVISGKEVISPLGYSQLHKVVLDDDDRRVVSEGGTLTLKEGYVLKMKDVDVGAGVGQIMISLLKDGEEVDTDVVAGNDNYIYTKKVGAVNAMPVIAIHFDSVFRGREVNAAFVRGIFQISEYFTPLKSGDRYGEMEVSTVSSAAIEMRNAHSVYLSRGNTIDLMGDLKIAVADSDVLRFALSVERTGTFEARGTIYITTDEWTPLNFGLNIGGTNIGFFYDMDRDIGNEDLKIEQINGNTIPRDRLRYSTSAQEISFDYSGFGTYNVIGFMAERYFAGYTRNSIITGGEEKSVLSYGQLHRVLLDDETKRTFTEGSTLTLKEGYVLKIKDVDVGAGQGQVLLALLKDGEQVDTDVISGRDTYIYTKKKVGAVSDLPIIAVNFESVFRGRETNAAFIKGIFQISESFASVKSGDRYGEMDILTVSRGNIEMRNTNSIGLSSGSTVPLMGDIKFRVADSGVLRFYPFVLVTPEMIANQLVIDAPAKATAGDAIRIKVTAGGKGVEGATVAIISDIGQTDKDGILNTTLKKTLKGGMYNLTATKLGYQKASQNIEIQEYNENRLSIDAPAGANQFENITIRITNKDQPVSGATVSFDKEGIGVTDSRGAVNYTLNASGTHTIYASKSGFVTAARDIDIRIPYAEFKALDIVAPDIVYSGERNVFTSNVTNSGTKAGTLPVVLIINNTEIGSQQVTLAPGEVKQVVFRQYVDVPAGNYTVEINGQKIPVAVRESQFGIYQLVGIVTVIGVIVIYLLTSKGKLSLWPLRKPPDKALEKKV